MASNGASVTLCSKPTHNDEAATLTGKLSILCAILAVAPAAPRALAGARIEPAPPPTRVARELRLYWLGTGQRRRLTETGSHTINFRCSHAEGEEAELTVRIEAAERIGEAEGGYERVDPDRLREAIRRRGPAMVQFTDRLGAVRQAGDGPGAPIRTTGGQTVRAAVALAMQSGVVVLVPRGKVPDFLASLSPGQELTARGRAFLAGGRTVLLADELRRTGSAAEGEEGGNPDPGGESRADEPAWTVEVIYAERTALTARKSGRYPVRLPCRHVPGAEERLGVQLREYGVVDLRVGDTEFTAQLADEPAERRRGLQGRPDLPQDHGMLFFFPRPSRPTFVMKRVQFPISVAFIGADGTVVRIGRLNPGDRKMLRPPVPINYVLEMKQGWFRDHDLRRGDKIDIP